MGTPATIRVRGVGLVHDGRGYHNTEIELPKSLAEYYIARGRAVQVESAPAIEPAAEAPVDEPTVAPNDAPTTKGSFFKGR